MSMISVIVPVYDDQNVVLDCLKSLSEQSYSQTEIIIVDDGSQDGSVKVIKQSPFLKSSRFKLLTQNHQGPATARNYGVSKSKGEILVFIDSDMVFDRHFLRDLVAPIERRETIGTFTKEERLLNDKNRWAVCWNINRYLINGWKLDSQMYQRMLPTYYQDKQAVFRAILKREFDRVGGFDNIGYTDDWTLSRKLKKQATLAPGAICYHRNPQTLKEVFQHARWIGGNEFLSGSILRRFFNLLRYSLPVSLLIGLMVGVKSRKIGFPVFKVVYDFGICCTVVMP